MLSFCTLPKHSNLYSVKICELKTCSRVGIRVGIRVVVVVALKLVEIAK